MSRLYYFHGRAYECEIMIARYFNGSPAIILNDCHASGAVAKATVCIPDYPLDPNHCFIKDYAENEGILHQLIENSIVRDTGITVPIGHTHANLVELLLPFEPDKQET